MKRCLLIAFLFFVEIFFLSSEPQLLKTQKDVTQEMLSADYWISKASNVDKVIMSPEEIVLYNEETRAALVSGDGWMHDLYEFSSEYTIENKKMILQLMRDEIVSDFLRASNFYIKGQKLNNGFWDPIIRNMNLNVQPDENYRMGIVVKKSNLRVCPIEQAIEDSLDDNESDAMMNTGILMNEPVLVLHESLDGNWFYVMSFFAKGWIRSSEVALCDDLDLWTEAQTFDDFLIVTGDKFALEVDPTNPDLSEIMLYMGTKLKLAPEGTYPEIVGNRPVCNNYVVMIPVRSSEGTLAYEYALVSPAKEISRGYLPYTTRNVLNLAFKCLGNRYGWGGQFNSRDCSEYTMCIYRCFGINLPRNSSTQAMIAGKEVEWYSGTPISKKIKDFKKIPAGAILRLPGHVMIYLGSVNGIEYCISAAGLIMSEDLSEEVYIRTVMVSSLNLVRRTGITWLESLTHAKFVRK